MDLTRREALAALAALAAVPTAAQAQDQPAAPDAATAKGTVFDDRTGKGTPDPASPGVPGVMVSNGRDVALTDADGRWSLPVRDGDSIFVVKPGGWTTPVDPGTQLPRFAYVHEPNGSPRVNLRFAGFAPTGPLPESIDFPLRRHEEPAAFRALLMTDPQPETLAELGYVRDDVVARLSGVPDAAFGITLGDIAFDDLSIYPRHNHIVGTVGIPWHNLPGNHDMNLEAPDNATSRETFKRVYGARHHAFQYAGTTFLLLDNVEYLGTDPTKPGGAGKYQGRFGPEQLGFVRNVLANVPPDRLVVFCFHIPLRTQHGTEPNIANTDTADFLAAISTHANTVSYSGHTHTNEHWYFGPGEGYAPGIHRHHVLAAASGSWWSGPSDDRGIPAAIETDGSPNGFHVLQVGQGGYATGLVPAHEPSGSGMRIVLDSQFHQSAPEVAIETPVAALLRGPISRDATGSTLVVVNLFDGGPRSQVEVRLANGPWRPMRRAVRKDPFVQEVYARAGATKKPWVQPTDSTHLWEIPLPHDLSPGAYRLSVRALDDYSRSYTDSIVLEVTG